MALAGAFFADRASMEGKVAVVTGAASGIGLEFATRCAVEYGMHVAMADIDAVELAREAEQLSASAAASGGSATAVPTDVRLREDIEHLLSVAQSLGGEVGAGCVDAALFNAGVLGAGVNVLKGNEADWRWVLDVNLFGVLHGLQVFTPVVAAQARPCLIAATASTQGLDIGGPPGSTASYATSKHGIMAMMVQKTPFLRHLILKWSFYQDRLETNIGRVEERMRFSQESLEGELAFKQLGEQVQLSVLCPGLVASGIWDVGKSEAQREPSENRGVQAKETQRRFFESVQRKPFFCAFYTANRIFAKPGSGQT